MEDPSKSVLLRYRAGSFKKLTDVKQYGKVIPRNVGQQFAMDALLSPDIPLVILIGEAGTAKTFLSVVAGMYGYSHDKWDQIIATRNNVEFDKGIGFLPGDEQEKVSPLLRGITDNLRTYFGFRVLQRVISSSLSTTISVPAASPSNPWASCAAEALRTPS